MSKFQKRLTKLSKNMENAAVIGTGFTHLPEILEIYKTVFVLDENIPQIRARNLVYREDFGDFSSFSEISAVIFDRNKTDRLRHFQPLWHRQHSLVIIEGDEPIPREISKPLYEMNYNCTGVYGFFHVWELRK